jgi:hypothetical protein
MGIRCEAGGNEVNCPKCGTLIPDPEWRDELKLNRIILIAATIVIAFAVIGAAIYAVGALRPRPELAGVLETAIVSGSDDGSDGDFTMSCSGYIYNIGTVGCFANVTIVVSDSRGWHETIVSAEDIGWLPPGETKYVVEIFWLPTTYEGQDYDLEDIQIDLIVKYYDPSV